MKIKLKFRKAIESDFNMLGEMNKRLIEDEGHSNPMNVSELTNRMESFLGDNYTAFMIYDESDIVGYCLFRDDNDFIYIRQLFIERNKRNLGYGKACIQWLKENLWQDRKIRTDVLSHNPKGIEFWRKIGFNDYCITMEMK
jgi:GNAT superfamily N-acetyltransferase